MAREEVIDFFNKKGIIGKNVLINIDYSHLIGIKRLLCKQYLVNNVYKGHGDPVDILSKDNPSTFSDIEETVFDEGLFASTDPYYLAHKKQSISE